MSMLDDVKAYLVANGVTNEIMISRMPDVEPGGAENTTVSLFQYGGIEPEFVHDDVNKAAMENPRLQVHCRAIQDQDAEAQAYVIWNLLSRVVNATINGHEYVRISPITSPFNLQRDEADRSIWTCNYRVRKGVE